MATASAKCPWCKVRIFKTVPSDCREWVAFECDYEDDGGGVGGCGKVFVGYVEIQPTEATEIRKVHK